MRFRSTQHPRYVRRGYIVMFLSGFQLLHALIQAGHIGASNFR